MPADRIVETDVLVIGGGLGGFVLPSRPES